MVSTAEVESVKSEAALSPKARRAVLAMPEYHPPLAGRDALRLDFNENTFAASPKVIERMREITAEGLTKYPEREGVEKITAQHFGVRMLGIGFPSRPTHIGLVARERLQKVRARHAALVNGNLVNLFFDRTHLVDLTAQRVRQPLDHLGRETQAH